MKFMVKDPEILTIATYNIELSLNVEKLVENISETVQKGIDVFCLQEVVNSPQIELIVDTILKKLGPDWSAACHLEEKTLRTNLGSCILWNKKRLQLLKQEKIDLPKIKRVKWHEILFAILVGGATFPLQRRAITCTFSFNSTLIAITSIHLDHVGGTQHRIQQLKYFLDHTLRQNSEIVCGDFNSFDLLQTGKEKQLLQQTFGSEFIDASAHTGPTADLYNMELRARPILKTFIKLLNIHIARKLDYIWVKNFEVVASDKQNISGSDHFPIIAKLTIKKQ